MEKTAGMAGSQPQPADTESFEYMLLEKDPDHYRTVFSAPSQISPWIDPTVLNLKPRARYGADLACGVLDLHSRGIFVLNLKPCNFLLDEHDHAVLGDFGIPSLLFGLSLPNPDLIQRLGTPNYMAPEQWQPNIRGPISYETDSWGFACSILEMFSGIQPWRGKSPDEIYQLVVLKKEKPIFPYNMPPEIENVLSGCFEYDFRDRPLMTDILHAFESAKDVDYENIDWDSPENLRTERPTQPIRTNWSHFKDKLQIGDKVRSRKLKTSCTPETMQIPEGTIVGLEEDGDRDSYILVRVHGLHDPLKVRSSTVERVTYGFAAGDWVRLREEDKKRSQVGILHSIDRNGTVHVGLIGMDILWKGEYSDLQMAETFCVGQFVRLRTNISSPRFEWQRKRGGGSATGRISQILSNGCLVVKFPGKFSLGEVCSRLADPSEVEVVSFDKCEGVVKKYKHLEDFHWAVRPLFIAIGFFTAMKLGIFVGKGIARPRSRKVASVSDQGGDSQKVQQQEVQNSAGAAWLPPPVANMLFGDALSPSG